MEEIDAAHIREAVCNRADDILEWTKALIRFASENRYPAGSEGPAQDFLGSECEKQGWEVDVFAPDDVPGIQKHDYWLSGRDYTGRRNVVARIPGSGGGRSLLLSGHVDVAPFEPDNWKICRPYDPVTLDGRIYGRGAADMKGGLAAAFWAMKILHELGFEASGDLLFESVVDEEFAGGNGALAARLRGHNADMSVIGEPTRMQVCPACLGAFLGDLSIFGTAGIPYTGSSIPNPINGAARAITLMNEWQSIWRSQSFHPLFVEPGKELNVLVWRIDSTREGEFAQMGNPLLTRMSWIVWCHPGMTEDEFYRMFRAYWHDHLDDQSLQPFDVKIEPAFHFVRPWETPADDPAVIALVEAFRLGRGEEPCVTGAPFSCDLAVYGDVGNTPSILLGPRGGNLHAPDEWVDASDILDLACIYATLAAEWCK